MAEDLTYDELKKRNRELEGEVLQYKTLIDNLPISVFAKDVMDNYKFIIWNKQIERVFGLNANDVLGATDYDIFQNKEEADYYRDADISVMKGQTIVDIPQEKITTQEGIITAHTRKIPIYDTKNNPSILLGCLEDITKQIQTEEALINSERLLKELNSSKDKFMSILAHDLKNPFNLILGFSDLLIENLHDFDIEEIESHLKLINRTAFETYELLEDMLLWVLSQMEKLPFNPVNSTLADVWTEIEEMLLISAKSKDITISVVIEENISFVVDRNMLKTILRNLITNAIKFTPRGGKISLTAEMVDKEMILSISDTGIGISPENILTLWDLMLQYRAKGTEGEKGTGFGLLLCKEFIEKHGMKIWVESELGKGSCFKFTLPLR